MTDNAEPAVLEARDARIEALETENARLRAQAEDAAAKPEGAAWRAWVSAVCIAAAAILVPVSIVAGWARVQLVDEDRFVATLAPLASDAEVQAMITGQTMAAITAKVDFGEITSSAFDGVAGLGLPPAAASALRLLQQPAAEGLESLVERSVTRVVESDSFADVWATTTRAAHRTLTTVSTSDGGGLVVRTDDGVGIQLGAIVERVKANLTEQGVGIAGLIPTVDRVIILTDGERLRALRTGYALATAVGYWLPVLTLALFAIGVLVARRRASALVGTGVGVFIGASSLAVGIAIGAVAVGTVAAQTDLPPSALDVIYRQISDAMARTAAVTAVLGAVVALLAWVQTRSRAAVAVRTSVAAINTGIRGALAYRGVDTGAFGAGLYARRRIVRAVIAVLAVVWLALLRPLTIGDIALVLTVSLIAWWVTELLQRRPAETVAH
ncbi:MAG: hypothetical protein DI566_09155 [Microbacterium sp.]|nr:MAG: hypothetical protein DI566_09155 [Microbacterium sp.]